MKRTIIIFWLVMASSLAFSQKKIQDRGIIYYKLGTDTTVIQYFEFSNDSYKTYFIQLTGAITKCEADGLMDKQGNLLGVKSANYRINLDGGWELTSKGINTFNGDSTIYVGTGPQGGIISRRSFPGQGILANGMDIASFYVFPYMGFYAPSKIGDTILHRQLSFNSYRDYIVSRINKNKLRIGSNLMGYLTSTVDKKGRLISIDGVGSSLNIIASVNRKNTDPQILNEIARRRNLTGMTAIRTTRDTARVILGNNTIEVDYWAPRRREREIFGNVVPWNRVWRTGANNATQLRFTQPITINGKKLPEGKYGLWSFLTEAKWELIVNKNANAWGTDHDPAADIFRVPYTLERISSPVEIMRIYFKKENEKQAIMVIEWDTYRCLITIISE